MALKQKLHEAAVAVEDLRRRLADAERNYDALFKQATSGAKAKKGLPNETPVNSQPKSQTPSANKPTGNFTDRIEALLLSDSKKEWSYSDILEKLPDIPTTTTPSLLFRLKNKGTVVKVGRGKWKAAS